MLGFSVVCVLSSSLSIQINSFVHRVIDGFDVLDFIEKVPVDAKNRCVTILYGTAISSCVWQIFLDGFRTQNLFSILLLLQRSQPKISVFVVLQAYGGYSDKVRYVCEYIHTYLLFHRRVCWPVIVHNGVL